MEHEYTKLPEWFAEGEDPGENLKEQGWQFGDKPPAEYFNWQWNAVYQSLVELLTWINGVETDKQPLIDVTAGEILTMGGTAGAVTGKAISSLIGASGDNDKIPNVSAVRDFVLARISSVFTKVFKEYIGISISNNSSVAIPADYTPVNGDYAFTLRQSADSSTGYYIGLNLFDGSSWSLVQEIEAQELNWVAVYATNEHISAAGYYIMSFTGNFVWDLIGGESQSGGISVVSLAALINNGDGAIEAEYLSDTELKLDLKDNALTTSKTAFTTVDYTDAEWLAYLGD